MPPDPWNPERYERFRDERAQPFVDLIAPLTPIPGGRLLDLGCGTASLTARAHAQLDASLTLGVDRSAEMLARAPRVDGLLLARGDIARPPTSARFDALISNAALHWLPDHARLLPTLLRHLAPGGQLAVQVPANHEHPSQTVAVDVCREAPFAEALGGWTRRTPVLAPASYAALLERAGLRDIVVRTHDYHHELPDVAALVEWMRGTTLTDTLPRLPEALRTRYLARYAERLAEVLGDPAPYSFRFRRLFFWARAG